MRMKVKWRELSKLTLEYIYILSFFNVESALLAACGAVIFH
jgi:hypothetical protein